MEFFALDSRVGVFGLWSRCERTLQIVYLPSSFRIPFPERESSHRLKIHA